MAFAFQPGVSPAIESRRIAAEAVEAALAYLSTQTVDEAAVHEVRKHMKKLRGLLRLLRRPLGSAYAEGNVLCRDVARCLSGVRDADVMLETLAWIQLSGQPVDLSLLQQCEGYLQRHRESLRAHSGDMRSRILEARHGLQAMAGQVADWSLPEQGLELVKNGLQHIYRQARDYYRLSLEQPSDEHIHDWRKRVKYHWYHCRLLEPLAPDYLGGRAGSLKSLSDIIGREHDLTVLRNFLSSGQEKIAGKLRMLEIHEALVALQNRQREQGWRLGGELFEQPAGDWTKTCLQACASD